MPAAKSSTAAWTSAPAQGGGALTLGLREQLADYADLIIDGWRYLSGRRAAPQPFDLVAVIEADGVSLRSADGTELASLPLGEVALAGAAALNLRKRLGKERLAVAVAVAESEALVLRRESPHAPARLLEAIVATDAMAKSPFLPERTRLAWTVTASRPGALSLETLIFDGEIMDALIASLAEAQVAPLTFARLGDTGTLWTARPRWLGARTPAGSWRRGGMGYYALLAALLAASAGLNLVYDRVRLQQIAPQARNAAETIRRVASVGSDLALVREARSAGVERLALLGAIAEALNDASYVESISLSADEIEFGAVSPSIAETLKVVSAIPALRDASLKSGVTRDAQHQERASISAKIPAMPFGGEPS